MAPEILDIVGVNCYSFGQMGSASRDRTPPCRPTTPASNRWVSLTRVWERYRRPMIVGETSGLGEGRADWLRNIVEESLAAVRRGIDLHGVCLFPAVDMPNWHSGEWLHNGICDLVEEGRPAPCPFEPYVAERRWRAS